MKRFRIDAHPDEFNLQLCVSSGQVFRWELLDDRRWMGVDGPNWYVATPCASGWDVVGNAGADAFATLFRLDESLVELEGRIVERGPELRPFMGALRGLRLLRCADPHEVLFTFLCTPNNNLARIKGMVRALGELGEPMDAHEGIVIRRFPSVERIATLAEKDLRAKGFGYRGRTIPDVARQILLRPEGWLEALRNGPYEQAHAELCGLNGIGPKLADCICLFGLQMTEAAPVDTHLWKACCRLYHPEWIGTSLTDQKYRAAATHLRQRFGSLTGWAHQYLFYHDLLSGRTGGSDRLDP